MDAPRLNRRHLGRTDLSLSCIGFGAFKIGRNTSIKYERGYDVPSDEKSDALLRRLVDELGINYVDTAPAYGISEERVGRVLGRRSDVVISTKVGETFEDGTSRFEFSPAAVRQSLSQSRRRLGRDALDLVFVHSSGKDLEVIEQTDVVSTLKEAQQRGDVRWIGFSGKTIAGALAAIAWADAIMVEYHLHDRSHGDVIHEAAGRGVGVVVKKGLASGRLPPREAIAFVLSEPAVTSMIIGGLSFDHLCENVAIGSEVQSDRGPV